MITDNIADKGGGLAIHSDRAAIMSDGRIAHNNATRRGGGVFIAPKAAFVMSGGYISHNEVTRGGTGGGVDVQGKFNIKSTVTIVGNSSQGLADNVYIWANERFCGTIFLDNPLRTTVPIGVTLEPLVGVFTSGQGDKTRYLHQFISDHNDFKVVVEARELALQFVYEK